MPWYDVHFSYSDPEDGDMPHPDSPLTVEADDEDDAIGMWMDADVDYPNGSDAIALVRVDSAQAPSDIEADRG